MNLFPKLFTLSKRFIQRTKHTAIARKIHPMKSEISLGTECREFADSCEIVGLLLRLRGSLTAPFPLRFFLERWCRGFSIQTQRWTIGGPVSGERKYLVASNFGRFVDVRIDMYPGINGTWRGKRASVDRNWEK